MAQVVKHPPRKCEALNPNPSTVKKKMKNSNIENNRGKKSYHLEVIIIINTLRTLLIELSNTNSYHTCCSVPS
jgi:hypothetical protein